ncbi:DUF1127 domain-containing protein [Mesorhizobium sp. Cs1299R1N1]|uniref:DUF1127 domain-containing protein n=1 Tax=Mesorhizobium sp. Cs1299R1N1 TaxID=3015172 RepID=UPI00301D34B2
MTLTLRPIGTVVSGLAMRSAAAFERRRTLRQISRLSDRRLHDIGLERDWDGSVLGNGRAI